MTLQAWNTNRICGGEKFIVKVRYFRVEHDVVFAGVSVSVRDCRKGAVFQHEFAEARAEG